MVMPKIEINPKDIEWLFNKKDKFKDIMGPRIVEDKIQELDPNFDYVIREENGKLLLIPLKKEKKDGL